MSQLCPDCNCYIVNKRAHKKYCEKVRKEESSAKTFLMIQMAVDLGFNAYWAGDRAKFGECPFFMYEMIENLIEAGWTRND